LVHACIGWRLADALFYTLAITGMEDDRHLMAAELPDKKPDLLMVEATR
jgi:hypothetical protein